MGSIYRGFIDKAVLPVYDYVRGTRRRKYRKLLEKSQWLTKKEIEDTQLKNLKAVLRHAYDTVPFYHQAFKERGLHPGDIKKVEDMIKLPVLTKQDIQNDKEKLTSTKISQDQLIPYHTGGTGNFIRFYITREQRSWELAAEYRAYGWADYELGDRCTVLWGSLFDTPLDKELLKRATNRIERIELYSTYVLKDEILSTQINKMRRFKPEVVRGYAGSVIFVAKKMLEDGVDDVRPRSVITSAESLLPEYRETIEEAFGCRVYDHYGTREIGAIASECSEHSGYHISAENVLLEFVMDGEHVAPGERGVIYATNLRNFGMPFIRYELGDVGKPSDETCSCGRGLPLMESIDGRVSQFLSLYDEETGKIIPVQAADPGVIGVVMDNVPQKTYRVYQETLEKITIEIEPRESYSEKNTQYILDYLDARIGKYVEIEVKLVDEIPPLPSGKRSVVVSKLNPFDRKRI